MAIHNVNFWASPGHILGKNGDKRQRVSGGVPLTLVYVAIVIGARRFELPTPCPPVNSIVNYITLFYIVLEYSLKERLPK